MTTENTYNEQSSLLQVLQSADPLQVIETIEELRVSGKVSDIPMLIEFLHLTQSPEVKAKIASLFASLKEGDAVPILVSAIQNPQYAPELQKMVSSCWENGLDYSAYLAVFTDLLIQTDFQVAFEAYTVIMNTENRIDQSVIDQQIDRLEKSLSSIDEQKRQLILDVIDFLPSIGQ